MLYEFNSLHKDDHYKTIWDNGAFIDSVTLEGFKMSLYAIDKFYVEVRYDSV